MSNTTDHAAHTAPRTTGRSRMIMAITLAMAMALLLAACGGADVTVGVAGDSDPATGASTFNPVAGDRILQYLTIEGDMEIDLEQLGDATPTMLIKEGTVLSGSTGCNLYQGIVAYDITGDDFTASIDSVTERACDSDVEKFFLQALAAANAFAYDGGQLTLTDNAEFPTTMVFVDAPNVSNE